MSSSLLVQPDASNNFWQNALLGAAKIRGKLSLIGCACADDAPSVFISACRSVTSILSMSPGP
jgi:hypothetical protein